VSPTPAEQVALWMMDQIVAHGFVTATATVAYIRARFAYRGDELVYTDPNGDAATRWPVTEAFRRISANTVRWDFRARAWIDRYPVDWMRSL
jgi:hypothetical protein